VLEDGELAVEDETGQEGACGGGKVGEAVLDQGPRRVCNSTGSLSRSGV